MKRLLKAYPANTTDPKGQLMSVDTELSVGDILQFSYFAHDQVPGVSYQSAFVRKGREVPGHFLISDLFLCTVMQEPYVFAELTALDPHFCMLYPVERITIMSESDLLMRMQNSRISQR